ncbi:hypothetical protein GGQ84_000879 [Desulfitispora alkaliphila]|uniref:S-layer homology domain-containing protein n=1 Tax=Desulfitispora alkaliphila TaxID=622674 RepID=UPI003D22F008
MKKSILVITLIIIYTVTALGAQAVQPGSDDDPLMSKGYLDRFLNEYFEPKMEQLDDINRQLDRIEELAAEFERAELPFKDVDEHWAKDEIGYLYYGGIVGGIDEHTFGPNQQVTRAQLAAMIVRAKGIEDTPGENPFTDLSSEHWAYSEILKAHAAGIVGGYDDGSFKPNANVTRAEIAAMLTRAYVLDGNSSAQDFKDVSGDHWAHSSIVSLVRSGITTGYEDNTFRPSNDATRAEVATFLARVLDPSKRAAK